MRVMHVITGLARGGAENMLYKLLGGMDLQRFPSVVVSLTPGGVYRNKIEALGVPVMDLRMKAGIPNPFALARLSRLASDRRADIVQSWMYHANLLASIAALFQILRVPVVWNIRQSLDGISGDKTLTELTIRLGAHLSKQPVGIVYNSRSGFRQHTRLGYASEHASVIPNGFDASVFRPNAARRSAKRAELGLDSDDFAVVHVARFHPMKDHGTYFAAARLLASDPRFVFLAAGKGVLAENEVVQAMMRGLDSSRVRLLGDCDDVPALLSAGDVFCLSSKGSEAFPNVLGEAMAAALPCVATDVGDCRHLLGDAGIVVPPGSPAALAKAITEVAALDPVARAAMGSHCRDRIARRYSLKRVAEMYETLYQGFRGASEVGTG